MLRVGSDCASFGRYGHESIPASDSLYEALPSGVPPEVCDRNVRGLEGRIIQHELFLQSAPIRTDQQQIDFCGVRDCFRMGAIVAATCPLPLPILPQLAKFSAVPWGMRTMILPNKALWVFYRTVTLAL
jgi:hypothetical protein